MGGGGCRSNPVWARGDKSVDLTLCTLEIRAGIELNLFSYEGCGTIFHYRSFRGSVIHDPSVPRKSRIRFNPVVHSGQNEIDIFSLSLSG